MGVQVHQGVEVGIGILLGANDNFYPNFETRSGIFSYKSSSFQVEAVYFLQSCIRE